MAKKTSPFKYRMLYATTPELIDYARKYGCNWVVVATTGHKAVSIPIEDPPVYMKEYEKMLPERRALRERIEGRRNEIRKLIRQARAGGMKSIYHCYEPCLPQGFQQAYPGLFCKYEPAMGMGRPGGDAEDIREVCVARPEVRDALADKVAEVCRIFDIDGFSYTNNESSTRTQVWHRCECCKDVPFSQMMKYLNDAMAEGIRRSGKDVKLFNRCWGGHEVDQQYWLNYKLRHKFGISELEDKAWLPAYAESHKPAGMHFVPKRDIPAYLKLLEGDDTAFIYKATWADVNIHQKLNPWLGKYKGHDQIVELSIEHSTGGAHNFFIMGRELQRRARLCAKVGVEGIVGVPINWGGQVSHFDKWSMHELNLHLYGTLQNDPDADIQKATEAWLKERYGAKLPAEVASLLLDTEDVQAEGVNINGHKVAGGGLSNFYYEILRYAWMVPNWQKKIEPTAANRKRIFAQKDRNVKKAEAMAQRIEQIKDKLPAAAYAELHERFRDLMWQARYYAAMHKHSMMLWAMKDGYEKPTLKNLETVFNYSQGVTAAVAAKGRTDY